jgi:hypothetical protein
MLRPSMMGVFGCWELDVGCWVLGAWCLMLDAGMLGCWDAVGVRINGHNQ